MSEWEGKTGQSGGFIDDVRPGSRHYPYRTHLFRNRCRGTSVVHRSLCRVPGSGPVLSPSPARVSAEDLGDDTWTEATTGVPDSPSSRSFLSVTSIDRPPPPPSRRTPSHGLTSPDCGSAHTFRPSKIFRLLLARDPQELPDRFLQPPKVTGLAQTERVRGERNAYEKGNGLYGKEVTDGPLEDK